MSAGCICEAFCEDMTFSLATKEHGISHSVMGNTALALSNSNIEIRFVAGGDPGVVIPNGLNTMHKHMREMVI